MAHDMGHSKQCAHHLFPAMMKVYTNINYAFRLSNNSIDISIQKMCGAFKEAI